MADIRHVIFDQIAIIAKQQNKVLAGLRDDLPLADSGLDSLCIAILVATLDDELDLDPFSTGNMTSFPVTLGDFVRLYELAEV